MGNGRDTHGGNRRQSLVHPDALATAPAVEIVALGRVRFVAQRCNEDGKAEAHSDVEHGLEDVGQRQSLVADGGGERLARNDEEERAGAGFEGKEEDLEATRGEVLFRLGTVHTYMYIYILVYSNI